MAHRSIGRTWLGLLAVAGIAVAACGTTSTAPANGGVTPSAGFTQNPNTPVGGTLNLGVWQEPTSFLDAGIVNNLTFSSLIDAPVTEGLLWYKSAADTASAKSLADYYQPWLAAEVPTTANGDVKTSGCSVAGAKMCVTWKLRSNVQWHDGSTFGSHDVCDTFSFFYLKYKDKNPTSLQSTSGWEQVLDCAEKDAHTAVVSFKNTFGPYLSLGAGVYGIIPSSVLDKAFKAGESTPDHAAGNLEQIKTTADLTVGSKNPDAFKGTDTLDSMMIGTGPFVFQKYVPGKEVDLVRNANYWNTAHRPHIEKLVFKFEADTNAEILAAKSGDIDMGFDYRLYNQQAMLSESKKGKLTVQTIPDSGAEQIDMNMCANAHGLCGPQAKKAPYTADPTIRKAILMAINRKQIVDDEAAGKTVIPHDAWQYLGVEYALDPSTNPQTAYDLAGAQKLLDDKGYKLSPNCDGGQTRAFSDGTCIVLDLGTTSDNPSRVATESLVQGDLAKAGIKVNVPFRPNLPSNQFFGTFADGGPVFAHNFDMAMYTASLSTPAEFDNYSPAYHADCGGKCPSLNQIPSPANTEAGQNSTGEDNPEVDKELDAGRATVDLAARATHYRKVEELLAKDIPVVPLYQQVTVNTATTRLQEFLGNDIIWDFNSYDWYCTGGKCQA